MKTATVSAQLPEELVNLLKIVSKEEERSKTYYIKKGLEQILLQRAEDLKDYKEGRLAYQKFLNSEEAPVSLEEAIKQVRE